MAKTAAHIKFAAKIPMGWVTCLYSRHHDLLYRLYNSFSYINAPFNDLCRFGVAAFFMWMGKNHGCFLPDPIFAFHVPDPKCLLHFNNKSVKIAGDGYLSTGYPHFWHSGLPRWEPVVFCQYATRGRRSMQRHPVFIFIPDARVPVCHAKQATLGKNYFNIFHSATCLICQHRESYHHGNFIKFLWAKGSTRVFSRIYRLFAFCNRAGFPFWRVLFF